MPPRDASRSGRRLWECRGHPVRPFLSCCPAVRITTCLWVYRSGFVDVGGVAKWAAASGAEAEQTGGAGMLPARAARSAAKTLPRNQRGWQGSTSGGDPRQQTHPRLNSRKSSASRRGP